MKTQIVVENNLLDLADDLAAQLTFAIDDVSAYASRNTYYSKTIVIPGTAQNNFIFGNLFDVNVYNVYSPGLPNVGFNYNAAKSAQCLVFSDNIQVFKGVIRILQINIINGFIEYECAVFGELGGLISNIGDSLLEVLDFHAYDHTFNNANIVSSWGSTPGTGYHYPLIDYGITTDGLNYDITNFKPALHVWEYINKILSGAGYTYSSSFIDAALFKRLIVPCNLDAIYLEINTLFHKNFIGIPLSIGSTSPYTCTYNNTIGTQYMSESAGVFTYSRTLPVTVNITATARVSGTDTSGLAHSCTVRVYKNGADVGLNEIFSVAPFASFVHDYNISGSLTLNTGDTLALVITSDSPSSFTSYLFVRCDFQASGNPIIKINAQNGDTLPVNGCIPKGIKQKDFFASIIQMFNLYVTEDKDIPKRLNIIPEKDFYDLTLGNSKDWTKKMDYSQVIKIKPLGEINSRTFEYKYKDDSDYYNDLYKKKFGTNYGSTLFDTGLEFNKDTQTVELIFSPTPSVNVLSYADRVVGAIYKVTNNVKGVFASNIRILYRSAAAISCSAWNIKDGVSTLSSPTSYGYGGHLDDPISPAYDLNWGAPSEIYFALSVAYPSTGLFNVYWSGYIAEITSKDSKLITAFFRLTAVDILQLDFSKFIFIGGQLFRLNKVIDYDTVTDQLTQCELTNVINVR